MSQLPPFSLSSRVTSSQAKQDSIQIELGNWFLQGDGSTIGAFIDLLGPRPNPNTQSAWINILNSTNTGLLREEHFGRIFNRPVGSCDQYTEISISGSGEGRAKKVGQFLAKGKLKIYPVCSTGEGVNCENLQRRKLRFTLKLNPTRYLRHQPIPNSELMSFDSSNIPLPEMFVSSISNRRRVGNECPSTNVEISLDGNDNVLLGEALLHYARPELWPQHLLQYMLAVEAALNGDFRRSAETLDLRYICSHLNPDSSSARRYIHEPSYAMHQVETYFEFSSPNPTKLLRTLQPALEAMGLNYRSRSYPHGLALASVGGDNAQSVKIRLSSGVDLKVYAKTTNRIRFEITHYTTQAAVTRLLQATGGGYTSQRMEEVIQWINRLAEDAANRVNNVLAQIEAQIMILPDSADLGEFCGAIFSVIRNPSRANAITTLLVENGCLRIGPNGSDLLPEIRQLRRTGFLKKTGNSDQVTPRYRKALDQLREASGLPSLYVVQDELLRPAAPRPPRPCRRVVERLQYSNRPRSRMVRNRSNASSCSQPS